MTEWNLDTSAFEAGLRRARKAIQGLEVEILCQPVPQHAALVVGEGQTVHATGVDHVPEARRNTTAGEAQGKSEDTTKHG